MDTFRSEKSRKEKRHSDPILEVHRAAIDLWRMESSWGGELRFALHGRIVWAAETVLRAG